jgi:thiamine kinase-like enzyme
MDPQAGTLELFLQSHGIESPFNKERIKAGRNSEVWKLFNRDGTWILKNYFQKANDPRDRLGTEFGFLSFLAEHGVNNVPAPICEDLQFNRGLYSFLLGERPVKIEAWHITQATDFIKSLNQHRTSKDAKTLLPAAEACFSIKDHLDSAQRRIQRLLKIDPIIEIEREAKSFVINRLSPAWEKIRNHVEQATGLKKNGEVINESDRILSPSDFGFHNTLQNGDNLYFVDFEYAGWDDPAKLISDFTCQPELPVSKTLANQFMEEIVTYFPNPESTKLRVQRLLSVHRIKWCCILLNEFNVEDRQRRLHAGFSEEGLLEQQLTKTERYFDEHLSLI